jgi:hypothetical protein
VAVAGALHALPAAFAQPGGVLVARPGALLLNVPGRGGTRLEFDTADDAARLALALLSVASWMAEDARRAASTPADGSSCAAPWQRQETAA